MCYYLGVNLVLDIQSSVAFWRRCYPSDHAPDPSKVFLPEPSWPSSLNSLAYNEHDVSAIISGYQSDFFRAVDGKLHVLTCSKNCHRSTSAHITHIASSSFPHGSFYELGKDLLVESPPFMFLRAASLLDLTTLIAFGNELCGFFSFDPNEERGFRKRRKPLTNKAQIERFLANASGYRGRKLSLAALPYVIEGCASPMEVFDEMTMCLPYKYGGYGIPCPDMNLCIPLNTKAMRIAKRQKCYLDMGWKNKTLDVEHHGKLDHSSPEDRASDRARVNALKEMGFEVIELTYDQISDLAAYEYIIERIAGILGKRIRKPYLGPTHERLTLRTALKKWNASYGAIQ